MKRFRLIGVALLAVFAFSVVAASAAQAEVAPSFTIGGTRLIAGRTHNIDAKAVEPFVLTGEGGVKIECEHFGTQEGVLLGSNPENPGKDNEVVIFSGCINPKGSNGANCHLSNEEGGAGEVTTLTTNPLKSEQVENVVNGTKGNQLLEEFFPASGSRFITLLFGGECTVFAAIVSGQVTGESLLDTPGRGTVELGQAPQERTSWLLNFPKVPITTVWLISNGVGKLVHTEQTTLGGKSIQTGLALVLLASTKFVPEPNALWSPLP
jgi:hypothetical protein